jgi:hypothetical protein
MSTDKITVQRAFNAHFIDLLNDIALCYPENVDIMTSKVSFENIKKLNPGIIIQVWYKYVFLRYKEQIDAGNVSFFFEKDYREDVTKLRNQDKVLNMIEKVREPLKSLDDKNKEHISNYLRNLNKLSFVFASL